MWLAIVLLTLLAIVALVFAWRADQRVRSSERELVQRQQDSAVQITEATVLARQAQESAREAAAKAALLEARLNEVAVQRGQLEALVQSVARSRDENLLTDSEATLRAGLQQSALHAKYFRENGLMPAEEAMFEEMAAASLAEQTVIEQQDTGSFDDFVAKYNSSTLCGN